MLENNSNDMKTVTETFLIEETVDLIYDNEKLNRWNNQVEELGLSGQIQIFKKDKSPIPFLFMKKTMVNIFETLCPIKINIKEFNLQPIPVEILDLVALSIKEQYFNEIQVWYDDKSPDPAVVGKICQYYSYDINHKVTKNYDTKDEVERIKGGSIHHIYEANPKYYLIGKWGDVKHSFDELKQMAINRYKSTMLNNYQQEIKILNRRIEDINNEAFNRYN